MSRLSPQERIGRRGVLQRGLGVAAYAGTRVLPVGGLLLADAVSAQTALPTTVADPVEAARDEDYWRAVRALYDPSDAVINLEHGNWGMMAKEVTAYYVQELTRVNRETSYYSRTRYGDDHQDVMAQLAAVLGVEADELVPVRNATEALTALIAGYNRLRPGDSVLYADLDYSAMQGVMNSLEERRGVKIRTLAIPEPATRAAILDAYENALRKDSRIRLVLLTHISHRTGLLLPIRELGELARRYDADVIVDSAHAWGQVDFRLPELGADFVGLNLHKWIGAPLGLGLMYVKRGRFAAIDKHPVSGGGRGGERALGNRVGVGTTNPAAMLSVPTALDIHARIGPQRKEARLRFLRERWAEALREDDRFEILTPADPALYAGITSFRLRGQRDNQRNAALARRLLEEFHIFTVQRDGIASGACVRVTPAHFSSIEEIDALTAALQRIA